MKFHHAVAFVAFVRRWRHRHHRNHQGEQPEVSGNGTNTCRALVLASAFPNVLRPLPPRSGRLCIHAETFKEHRIFAKRAVLKATRCPDFVDGQLRLVFLVDGSRRKGHSPAPQPGGYAVAHKLPGTNGRQWTFQAWLIPASRRVVQTELMGITEGMAKVVDYIEENDIFSAIIQMFADSQNAVDLIGLVIGGSDYTGHYDRDVFRPILLRIARLSERIWQRHCKLEVRWAKRETCLYHSIADDLSRDAWTDAEAVLEERSDATADLDEEVEDAAQRWHSKRVQLGLEPGPTTREVEGDLVGRVIELRRMAKGPEPLGSEMESELEVLEKCVGHLVD